MIIINQTTADQMMEDNPNLKIYEDIYNRTYLVGTGAEILILNEDQIVDITNQINQRMGVSNDRLSSVVDSTSGSS